MRAIVQHEYGQPKDVLELQDIEQPPVGDSVNAAASPARSARRGRWTGNAGEALLVDLLVQTQGGL